jgi:hypothetical protein
MPIMGFALGKPIASRLPLVIDAIGVIDTSTISLRRRREGLPPLHYLFGCGEAGYGVFVAAFSQRDAIFRVGALGP